jgi:solute carrier family 6 (neurotransmitter transporter)
MKNMSGKLEETVPDYFSSIVLQRHTVEMPESSFGHLKFQVAFNLAVVWMIVFVSLSKGMLRPEMALYSGVMLSRIYS